jgi:uncharacterized protein (UPF0332 family)
VFAWDDFLVLADRLADETDDEASQRTAISRAYYAAYHAAAAFVRAQRLLSDSHTYRRVWDAFARMADSDGAIVGALGDRLRQRRQLADYRTPYPGDVAWDAGAAKSEARIIVDLLRRMG